MSPSPEVDHEARHQLVDPLYRAGSAVTICADMAIAGLQQRRLAERARAAGLHVEQACFDGVGYVFQFHAGVLAEADQCLLWVN